MWYFIKKLMLWLENNFWVKNSCFSLHIDMIFLLETDDWVRNWCFGQKMDGCRKITPTEKYSWPKFLKLFYFFFNLKMPWMLQTEKTKRNHLEKLHLKTSMQCQMFASENAVMRKKIMELEMRLKVSYFPSNLIWLTNFVGFVYATA